LIRGHLIRSDPPAHDGLSQVITPGWPDAAREDEAQLRSEGTGLPLAEILKVRERRRDDRGRKYKAAD
jgi:hypothetical protein